MASSWKSLCRGTRSEKMPRERSTSRSRPRFSANQHCISVPLSAPAGKLAALEGVEHQVHLPTDALADGVHDGDLALERRRLPAVNFVGGIAHFQALPESAPVTPILLWRRIAWRRRCMTLLGL